MMLDKERCGAGPGLRFEIRSAFEVNAGFARETILWIVGLVPRIEAKF